tara:strand:+ start:4887 stop:5198 length:312 start_codon:yes stop_codon:yes gene_type:complete
VRKIREAGKMGVCMLMMKPVGLTLPTAKALCEVNISEPSVSTSGAVASVAGKGTGEPFTNIVKRLKCSEIVVSLTTMVDPRRTVYVPTTTRFTVPESGWRKIS